MKKPIKYILITICILIVAFFLMVFRPWVFLPHEHIEIGLPFKPEVDSYTYLIPMGEKIEHNESNGNENGHPGVDFGWDQEVEIIAIADGVVSAVSKDKEGRYVIVQSLGYYRSEYKELNSIEPNIHFGTKLMKGDVIGRTGTANIEEGKPGGHGPSRQIHWDFASSSMYIDRLCPLTYFDTTSKNRIEKIWDRVPSNDQFKKLYPEICNGYFKDRVD